MLDTINAVYRRKRVIDHIKILPHIFIINKGCEIKVEKFAPLGDPIDIRVKDYHIAIRKSDAKNIIVK